MLLQARKLAAKKLKLATGRLKLAAERLVRL